MSKVVVRLEAFEKPFIRGMGAAGVAVRGFGNALKSSMNLAMAPLRGVGGLVRSLRYELELLAVLGVRALQRFVKESVQLGAKQESQQLGLLNILGGDQKQFKVIYDQLYKLAKLPGITFDESLGGFSQLRALDVDLGLSLDIIREMGNAIALAGGGAQEFARVMRGVVQVFGKGKVQAEELNLQIFESAPLLRKAYKMAFGATPTQDLAKLGVGPEQFFELLTEAAKSLPRAADATKNAMENFGIAWDMAKGWLGRGIFSSGAMGGFGSMTEWLEKNTPLFYQAGQAIGQFAGFLMSKLRWALESVDWTAFLANAQEFAVGLWDKLQAAWPKVKEFFADLWDRIKQVDWAAWGKAAITVGQSILGMFQKLAPVIGQIGSSIAAILEKIGDFLAKHPEVVTQLVGAWAGNKLGGQYGAAAGAAAPSLLNPDPDGNGRSNTAVGAVVLALQKIWNWLNTPFGSSQGQMAAAYRPGTWMAFDPMRDLEKVAAQQMALHWKTPVPSGAAPQYGGGFGRFTGDYGTNARRPYSELSFGRAGVDRAMNPGGQVNIIVSGNQPSDPAAFERAIQNVLVKYNVLKLQPGGGV